MPTEIKLERPGNRLLGPSKIALSMSVPTFLRPVSDGLAEISSPQSRPPFFGSGAWTAPVKPELTRSG